MSSPLDRPLKLEVKLPSSHPRLLEGLDMWLRLGLISDFQVKQLCREFLVCQVVLLPQTEPEPIFIAPQPIVLENPLVADIEPKAPAKPSVIATMLQSLGAELSVRWLLFLGVFLVVLSSGVLAASQWDRFPAAGQYGVLWAYTLSFWGFSVWTGRQSNLRLTAQTLVVVTLLLVPVNFWAMDSFGLWLNPLNWIVLDIASLTLSFLTHSLCKNTTVVSHLPVQKLAQLNILGLSYLNLGWKLPGFPLIAIYIAMVGTTVITVYLQNYQSDNSQENIEEQPHKFKINFAATIIVYTLLLLLVRAIFIAGVNVTHLGLAIGVCGWLLIWLLERETLSSSFSSLQARFADTLMFLGWLVSVFNQPAQAIIVSILSLWVFNRRLYSYNRKSDLTAVFLIGLQTIWLGWRLVPSQFQQLAIAIGTNLTHAQHEPWALLSVVLFPYLILMVVLTNRLNLAHKSELANFGEVLSLFLGSCLTIISLINPTLRSLKSNIFHHHSRCGDKTAHFPCFCLPHSHYWHICILLNPGLVFTKSDSRSLVYYFVSCDVRGMDI